MTTSYVEEYDHSWEDSRPISINNGTKDFFEQPRIPGIEELYAWIPDGWLAAQTNMNPPDEWIPQQGRLTPKEYQDWFDQPVNRMVDDLDVKVVIFQNTVLRHPDDVVPNTPSQPLKDLHLISFFGRI